MPLFLPYSLLSKHINPLSLNLILPLSQHIHPLFYPIPCITVSFPCITVSFPPHLSTPRLIHPYVFTLSALSSHSLLPHLIHPIASVVLLSLHSPLPRFICLLLSFTRPSPYPDPCPIYLSLTLSAPPHLLFPHPICPISSFSPSLTLFDPLRLTLFAPLSLYPSLTSFPLLSPYLPHLLICPSLTLSDPLPYSLLPYFILPLASLASPSPYLLAPHLIYPPPRLIQPLSYRKNKSP